MNETQISVEKTFLLRLKKYEWLYRFLNASRFMEHQSNSSDFFLHFRFPFLPFLMTKLANREMSSLADPLLLNKLPPHLTKKKNGKNEGGREEKANHLWQHDLRPSTLMIPIALARLARDHSVIPRRIIIEESRSHAESQNVGDLPKKEPDCDRVYLDTSLFR